MQPRLVITKILIPSLDKDIVPRQALSARLDEVKDRKLALISAPAGFGKTTSVLSWLSHNADAQAWLSLDENDNNLLAYLRYFAEAVHRVLPGTCENTLQSLQLSQSLTANGIAPALLHDLAQVERPLFIVLDDYHLIHDGEIHDLMRLLIKRLPASVHLVLITRIDPPLPLPSLRVQKQLVELRGQDLRFNDKDAQRFLATHGQTEVDRNSASRLNQQLDGWIAGLQLASLALKVEGRHDGDVGELDLAPGELLSEYFADEVLIHLPATTQSFLMATSILERFSLPLCEAVLDGADGLTGDDLREILDGLRRTNLFIITVDRADGWYRYHHLLQHILRRRLMDGSRRSVEELHRRAAVWYADNGYTEEALQHAIAANDLERAIALIEARCHNFLNGMERHILERWIAMLPDEVIWQRPTLLTANAWLLYRHWRLDSLDVLLDALDALLVERPAYLAPDHFENLCGQVHALRSATKFHVHMDFCDAIEAADLAEKRLPATEGGALGTALLHRAMAQIGGGERNGPIDDLTSIMRSPAPTGPAKAQAFIGLAFIYCMLGDLDQLERACEHMQLRTAGSGSTNATADWFIGLAALERNRLRDAAVGNEVMYQIRHQTNFVGGFYSGYALARIAQLQGRYDEAQSRISDLFADSGRLNHDRFLEVLDAFQALQWMLTGEVDAALRWARTYDPEARRDLLIIFDAPGLIWSRVLTALGTSDDRMAVCSYLSSELDRIHDSQFVRRRVQLLAHLAGACAASGDLAAASGHLRTAINIAEPLGLVRSIADVGPPLVSPLQQLLREGLATTFVPQILDAMPDAELPKISVATATLLTRREQEVLNLMRTGNSNREIADTLIISIHTVKRHAINIYNKLTVNNRQEAIYRATELGILK